MTINTTAEQPSLKYLVPFLRYSKAGRQYEPQYLFTHTLKQGASDTPDGLVKTPSTGPHHRASDSVDLGGDKNLHFSQVPRRC